MEVKAPQDLILGLDRADQEAGLLLTHHAQLPVWAPQDSQTRAVQELVAHRRAVVDERTALCNRLIALLNQGEALTQCASRRRRNGVQALPAGARWRRRSSSNDRAWARCKRPNRRR